jgi:hypothetical protein
VTSSTPVHRPRDTTVVPLKVPPILPVNCR